MAVAAVAQRVIQAVGESPVADKVAEIQVKIYGPLIDWAVRSPFHTDALGHSVHPVLTDVTIGCWLSSSVLDLAGGSDSRRSATLLVGAGLIASGPTAIAGAADWAGLTGEERRIGAIHSLSTDVASFLFLGSLIARLRGRDSAGTAFGLAGNVVLMGAGFLGGHLALTRGTARRDPATEH